jgi:hypothetical protein
MARLDREAKERERQRILAEQRDIQKKHALERIEQLKKSELGARVVQNIDEEVSDLHVDKVEPFTSFAFTVALCNFLCKKKKTL